MAIQNFPQRGDVQAAENYIPQDSNLWRTMPICGIHASSFSGTTADSCPALQVNLKFSEGVGEAQVLVYDHWCMPNHRAEHSHWSIFPLPMKGNNSLNLAKRYLHMLQRNIAARGQRMSKEYKHGVPHCNLHHQAICNRRLRNAWENTMGHYKQLFHDTREERVAQSPSASSFCS